MIRDKSTMVQISEILPHRALGGTTPAMQRFPCRWPGCTKEYTTSGNLNQHIAAAHNCKRFRCSLKGCGKTYTRAIKLTKHEERAHPGELFICARPRCRKTFRIQSELAAHIAEQHNRAMFVCPHEGCNKTYMSRNSLFQHFLSQHEDQMADLAAKSDDDDGDTRAEKDQRASFPIGEQPGTSQALCGHAMGMPPQGSVWSAPQNGAAPQLGPHPPTAALPVPNGVGMAASCGGFQHPNTEHPCSGGSLAGQPLCDSEREKQAANCRNGERGTNVIYSMMQPLDPYARAPQASTLYYSVQGAVQTHCPEPARHPQPNSVPAALDETALARGGLLHTPAGLYGAQQACAQYSTTSRRAQYPDAGDGGLSAGGLCGAPLPSNDRGGMWQQQACPWPQQQPLAFAPHPTQSAAGGLQLCVEPMRCFLPQQQQLPHPHAPCMPGHVAAAAPPQALHYGQPAPGAPPACWPPQMAPSGVHMEPHSGNYALTWPKPHGAAGAQGAGPQAVLVQGMAPGLPAGFVPDAPSAPPGAQGVPQHLAAPGPMRSNGVYAIGTYTPGSWPPPWPGAGPSLSGWR